MGDHTGLEHLTPEDTLDADYGRVLERAYAALDNHVKGMSSPTRLAYPSRHAACRLCVVGHIRLVA